VVRRRNVRELAVREQYGGAGSQKIANLTLKLFLAVAVVAITCVLALIQVASDAIAQNSAAHTSLLRVMPHSIGVDAYTKLADAPFSPQLVRRVAAEAAIDDGRLGDAYRFIALLPDGPEKADLQGRLLEALGDHEAAIEKFVAAGDLIRVAGTVDALDREGRAATAVRVQRRLVAKLQSLGDQITLAHAYWRLAQLESGAGEHASAASAYSAAVALEPLSETFLLGAANEALIYGSLASAGQYFERVIALDPTSLDGNVGVGRVAARTGNIVRAEHEADFIRARDPSFHDLPVLEQEIAQARSRRR
jgi:tetratricopeptide (TPR) repeat protein